jgi:hypothetical protein
MIDTIEFCELCDAPLDADNCYGEEDFPLCRYHHEMVGKALGFLLELGRNEKPMQQLTIPSEKHKNG